jgi:hypothetical protein
MTLGAGHGQVLALEPKPRQVVIELLDLDLVPRRCGVTGLTALPKAPFVIVLVTAAAAPLLPEERLAALAVPSLVAFVAPDPLVTP